MEKNHRGSRKQGGRVKQIIALLYGGHLKMSEPFTL